MFPGPEANIHLGKVQAPHRKPGQASLLTGLEEKGGASPVIGGTPSILCLLPTPLSGSTWWAQPGLCSIDPLLRCPHMASERAPRAGGRRAE